ncbi:hypothetical protein F511_17928 [Dorcoceras hygrometricum]|uniref:Uncharacterized protein n=1 Tax=Dorcoceras hygrometricum TaxID=472368 RepID=A0A2Z7AUG7_9LAMI|nr:hypothetical protein F511_17928 [Dorcoceras hygrometricum]
MATLVTAMLAKIAAQHRALASNLSVGKLQSQEILTSFKSDFNERMTSLEQNVKYLQTSHDDLVNRQWRQHLDLLRWGNKLKADLSSEITSSRLMLQEEAQKTSSEVNSSLASLSSQLAEVFAHLKRAGDVRKEEDGSSSSKERESSSADRYRDSGWKRRWV